eukprot:TRINITY_DN4928_c0_g2_i2.p1 TRINITY_DN4928_c0_g2~~TRINITY_DN4928_c0_g2_i2.p1  ORF type:complete len:355 (-),score=91.12 TRINITY_DN4928_c0_g2_i2:46-963(-)
MNALQLSWTVEGAEKLTSMISSRIGDEIIHLSEDEVLGEWYEKVEECSNDLGNQLQLYLEVLTNIMSLYPGFMRVLRSKLRCDIQELVSNENEHTLQKWLPKLVLTLNNDDKRARSALLFQAKSGGLNDESVLFQFMCHVFGTTVEHMHDHVCPVCFDVSNSNVKVITNNGMTIKGTHRDDQWHGALLNLGIYDGIAEWEVNIDSINNLAEMGIGIFEKDDALPDWSCNNRKTIRVRGFNGSKYIRGTVSAYCQQLKRGYNTNQVLTMRLDMTKGALYCIFCIVFYVSHYPPRKVILQNGKNKQI